MLATTRTPLCHRVIMLEHTTQSDRVLSIFDDLPSGSQVNIRNGLIVSEPAVPWAEQPSIPTDRTINLVALRLLNFKLPDGSLLIPKPQSIAP